MRGKRFILPVVMRGERDHPRACGENQPTMRISDVSPGSPPRMRGKPLLADFLTDLFGITPAHAGKTKQVDRFAHCFRDHPRACGENDDPASRRTVEAGSPPRMRGKHFGKGVFPWLILVLSLDPL